MPRQRGSEEGSHRIVKARWVLTWKPVPPEDRLQARSDEAQNPETLHGRDGSVKAKARIVLLGFQHPNLLDPSFKTSSPVQSALGRNLLYTLAVQRQCDLEGLDLATAFLPPLVGGVHSTLDIQPFIRTITNAMKIINMTTHSTNHSRMITILVFTRKPHPQASLSKYRLRS